MSLPSSSGMFTSYPLLAACEPVIGGADRAARIATVPEALVHDIWHRREYDHLHLETTSGQPVLVLDTGKPNRDAGPDFLNARIQIGRTEWVGDVEIHRTSSEWIQHRHDRDARYNRVVLHVVMAADLWTGRLRREDGTMLTEIALSGFIRKPLRRLLVRLHREDSGLPCGSAWPLIPDSLLRPFVAEMADVRLDRRAARLRGELAQSADLDQVVYSRVLETLGYSKNREPMAELARRVPLSLLRRLSDRIDLEAVLLGTAGLIPSPGDVEGSPADIRYVDAVRTRFNRLRDGVAHRPMERTRWRFFRLRPSNFPPIRIAQGAALVRDGLLSRPEIGHEVCAILQRTADPLATLRDQLSVSATNFWMTHVRLERPVRGGPSALGAGRINQIILNALLPAAVHVATVSAPRQEEVLDHVRRLVRSLPAEDDEVTRVFDGLALGPRNAEVTQGLHEIHDRLCLQQGCLRCRVGRFILSG